MSELLTFITVTLNGVLGLLIFFKNRKAKENFFYALFVIFLDFWIIANFLENEPGRVGLHNLEAFLRFDFVFGALVMYAWLRFCLALAIRGGHQFRSSSLLKLASGGMALVFVPLSLWTDTLIHNIQFYDSIIHFDIGPLFAVYALYLIACLVGGPVMLLISRRFARKTGNTRLSGNINLILIGFAISFVNAIFINLLQPFLALSLEWSRLGIYGLNILVVFTAYAIIRHQFLNVKIIAVETFAICLVIFSTIQVLDTELQHGPILRISILIGTILASIFIVRSVRKEVKQREELEGLTAKLGKANKELENLSRFKSQLLSLASHQIKSPLAIIKGYLTILLDGLYGPTEGKIRDTLEKMKKSSDSLTELIDDLLNLRKVEEGKMDYRFAMADIVQLVEGIVDSFRVLAYQKGLILDLKVPEGPVMIEADSNKLHEVFQNLVDNAIKYTPKGSVRVAIEIVGGKVLFSIRDSGLGISPQLLPHLFSEFVRDERIRKDIKGSGFGLYIAKKIIDAHHGRIWAESEGDNKGSSFFVELALSPKTPKQ